MKEYQKIGVFLNESSADVSVLAFVDRIASLAESEAVHCLYAPAHSSDDPMARQDPEGFVKENLSPEVLAKTQFTVCKGKPLAEMLKLAREESLDIILVGRYLPSNQVILGSGFHRLARKAPCTVLVVPEHTQAHLARILVPVDFSSHSRLALDTALDFARSCGESTPQVVVQTVFHVGYGYHKAGLTLEQASTQLQEVTAKKLDEFTADIDTTDIIFEKVCTCSERPSAAIGELASVRKMDLVCVGSRGATSDVVALVGGTTEHVLAELAMPVLVAKKKGETASFLEVLFGQLGD